MKVTHRIRVWLLGLAGLAVLSAPASAEDDPVLEELRALRERVLELENWKSRREGQDAAAQDGVGAAIREYLAAHPDAVTPSSNVFAPGRCASRSGANSASAPKSSVVPTPRSTRTATTRTTSC